MSSYIFESNSQEQEYRRLRMVETANDPNTIPLLKRTGIQPGWTCLELGPGAGSILRWMGKQVGTEGIVLGVDKTTVYLKEFSTPPYDIRTGSFLDVSLDYPFDLIHARYVLIHNQQDMEMLTKVHDLLKPGGVALIEEPDFTSAKLCEKDSDHPHARVNSAICHMFINLGLNPAYGLSLPQKLQACRFQIIETHSKIHLNEGNSPMANVMAESAVALQKAYCSTGECSEQDIQSYIRHAHTPGLWTIYHSTVSVIAKR